MEECQYPLYFEAGDLTEREKKKIERYFQIKRESGGGECEKLQAVGDGTYKICFMSQETQEMVLSRKNHIVSLPHGQLSLTVSRSNPLQSLKLTEQPSTSHPEAFRKTNEKELQKVFRLDLYLLYYLRDSPKATKFLRKQLSAIGCSVRLNPDEEEAVVTGNVDKGPGGDPTGAAERWERLVDQIFTGALESYLPYHVLEPEKVKTLLQDLSFQTEDLRVYKESGFAVIVGEVAQVEERIAVLEEKIPTRKEITINDKHYNLIEEAFKREFLPHSPEVKIHKDQPHIIIFEGDYKEVEAVSAKFEELTKEIKQKTIQFPDILVNFLTYSGAITKYEARFKESLGDPVSLEIAASNLVLTSLSSRALDEAAAAVQGDVRVETVQLEKALSVAPCLDRLKDTLTQAESQANRRGLRVVLSYTCSASGSPSPSVQLIGYSEDVGRVKQVLMDYQLSQEETQLELALPFVEMVDMYEEILSLMGMKTAGLKMKASRTPSPCVVLTGLHHLVHDAQEMLSSGLSSVIRDDLSLDGPWAHKYFQGEGKRSLELVESSYHVLIRDKSARNATSPTTATPSGSVGSSHSRGDVTTMLNRFRASGQSQTTTSSTKNVQVNKIRLEIKLGQLEDQQADVFVVPMINRQLMSTKIGDCLVRKIGQQIRLTFDSLAKRCNTAPGEVLQVDGTPTLSCSKMFFIECVPWDGPAGQSIGVLRAGLRRCLGLCSMQHWRSVALPVIGPGVALKFPLTEAVAALTEEIAQFGRCASAGSVSNILVVVKHPDTEQAMTFVSLTSDLEDLSLALAGGVRLELVFGNITDQTTDVVVNPTNFRNLDTNGVCKDILTLAGPQVKETLKQASVNKGELFASPPGMFPCRAIVHVCGDNDEQLIQALLSKIVQFCEVHGHQSVAVPAIGAGQGGLAPGVVARAILGGVRAAMDAGPPRHVSHIRLVLAKINVFLAFKEAAKQIFASARTDTAPMTKLPLVTPPVVQSPDLSLLPHANRSAPPRSVFLVVGLEEAAVADAKRELERLYRAQCSSRSFSWDELAGISPQELASLGLSLKPSQGGWTISGLKDDVNEGTRILHCAYQHSLRRQMKDREEEDLYRRVAWCILGIGGVWERLPKGANHDMETGNVAAGGMVYVQEVWWKVDLARMEATAVQGTGGVTKLKRLENLPDFTLPLYWDHMAAGEQLKIVQLDPLSVEFRSVTEGFKRTVNKTVLKVQRLQNVHLRRAYEVRRRNLSEKNCERTAAERLLYHGTTAAHCRSIVAGGFNRRFAGENATAYGLGTYFAVDARYSANPTYSKPGADGSQVMFVARVLTGTPTLGHEKMVVPPPRDPKHPHDRFDSLVDNLQNPKMFVVFHDNQVYPDYLITFK